MCGIVGVIFPRPQQIGDALLKMLHGCQHRGPDSTGLAMYAKQVGDRLVLRLFYDAALDHDASLWPKQHEQVQQVLTDHGFKVCCARRQGAHARIVGEFNGDIQKLSYAVEELDSVEIFSAGHNLEIIKDEGTAHDIESRFDTATFVGYHGIGHVRLATESDVNPSTAHPFWAYGFTDVAIVHNGQITNYFKLRRRLEQRGYRFRTENDSEVIAVFLADKMTHGVSMDEALAQSLYELDGTFSFLVSTPSGIGFAKDSIGAKPMIVCETEHLVAVASEEVALQQLFDHEKLETYEPAPGTSHTWFRSTQASLACAR